MPKSMPALFMPVRCGSWLPIRLALASLLTFGLAACAEADPPPPQVVRQKSAKPASPPPVLAVEDKTDWDALLLRMRDADKVDDDVERCLAYPDVPEMTWSREIVEARCAMQRKPKYDLDGIAKQIASAPGRAALETHFAALLKAHYDMPSERDQIGIAFDIFDDSPDATEIAKRWHTLSPDSAYSRLAYGKVLYAAAGSTRGSRTASETPEIDMRNARAAAAVAADMLQSALVVEPRLTPACTARVVAVRLSGGDEEPFAIGRQCVQRDPLSYFAALSWKGAAEPRWGGSDAQLSVVEAHILEHRDANPLLNSVLAALVADPLLNVEPNPQDATLAALERAARIAPHGQVLNQLSGSWFARGDKKRGFAYLSQAVRFNIGSLAHRNERMRMNVFMQPEWAKIDLAYLLRRYPTSVYYRQQLAQAEDNLRNGVAEKMARGETVTIDDGGASRKATFLSQCEEYGLSGKRSSDVMNECSDNLVMEWPEDPEAWRVRADVLHARGDPRALDAARKYLEIAPEDAPDREKRAARYRQWLKAAGG